MAAGRYVSWQYDVRVSQDEQRARDDYRAMQFEFNELLNKIMRIRDNRRGRPGAALPPVYFDDYFNNPEEVKKVMEAYLTIERWKEKEGR